MKNEKGQIIFELAIMIPFFAILFFFAIDATRIISAQWELDQLARTAARIANITGASYDKNDRAAVQQAYKVTCSSYNAYVSQRNGTADLRIPAFQDCSGGYEDKSEYFRIAAHNVHASEIRNNLNEDPNKWEYANIQVTVCGTAKITMPKIKLKNQELTIWGTLQNGEKKMCTTYNTAFSKIKNKN